MNKVISIQEYGAYTDYQLKLIAYNIIDHVCAAEDIFVDDIIFNNGYRLICHFCTSKKTVINDIVIGLNRNILDFTASSYGIPAFIKSYDIPDNYQYVAGLTFLILHELGHAVFNMTVFKRLKNKEFNKYFAFEDIIKNSIYMMFPIRKKHYKKDDEFNYCFDPVEQMATQYAYLHFKEIWDMLVSRELIYNE